MSRAVHQLLRAQMYRPLWQTVLVGLFALWLWHLAGTLVNFHTAPGHLDEQLRPDSRIEPNEQSPPPSPLPTNASQAALPSHEETNPFSALWNNSIVLCAVMKREHVDDVREWLQYHRYMGVDHVLLYDNSMNGGAQAQELRDFIRDGFVTFTLLPGQGRQIPLYDHCAKISARKWAWMVAIDLDEFLDLPEANTTSVEKGSPLKALLAEFRFRPGLMVPWVPFGPSEHVNRPPGGPLQHYTQCVFGSKDNTIGKTIANTHWVSAGSSAHSFWYRDNGVVVTDGLNPIPPEFDPIEKRLVDTSHFVTESPKQKPGLRLAVNHYITRSLEDFKKKQLRGGGARKRPGHYRSIKWFAMMKKEQVRNPACTHIQPAADACCQRDGAPWPVFPAALAKRKPLKLPILTGLPNVHLITPEHARLPHTNEVITGPNPFASDWRATTAICSHVPLDRPLPKAASLVEWFLHHRYLGVDAFMLYVYPPQTPEDDASFAALKKICTNDLHDSVQLQVLPANASSNAQEAVQTVCIAEQQQHYTWLAFLGMEEYLSLRSAHSQDQPGRLKVILHRSVFRYAPGVVLPVYTFGSEAELPDDQTPLRWYTQCHREPAPVYRTLANSHWLSHSSKGALHYRGDYLPITDTLVPWPRAAEGWSVDGVSQPFTMDSHVPPAVEYPTGNAHFGDTLAVFKFPAHGTPSAQAPATTPEDAPTCAHAMRAAAQCCA